MRASLFTAAVLLCSSIFAHADIIDAFNFHSDLTNGYTAQGLVSIDVTDGQIVSSDFTLTQNGVLDATFTQPEYSQATDGAYLAEFQGSVSGYTYELLLPNSSLINFQGGGVCTTTSTCLGGYPSGVYLPSGGDAMAIDGTLSPTPEPASLIMLATGLVAGCTVLRRRWA